VGRKIQVLRFASRQGPENFLFQTVLTGCRTHPPSNGYLGLFRGLGHEADRLYPYYLLHIKIVLNYTSAFPCTFTTRCLNNTREDLSFSVHTK